MGTPVIDKIFNNDKPNLAKCVINHYVNNL